MKTQLQKMLDGELYEAWDPQLTEMRAHAKILIQEYNQQLTANLTFKTSILKKMLGTCSTLEIIQPFFCDYGVNIHIGENFFMNFNCIILDCAKVTIGNNVMCGPYVQIYTAYHPIQASERIKGPELASPIVIGNNVWIGGGAIICPGVTIGDNTTIGAGSVVTKGIPSNVFAAGNPCKVIRNL